MNKSVFERVQRGKMVNAVNKVHLLSIKREKLNIKFLLKMRYNCFELTQFLLLELLMRKGALPPLTGSYIAFDTSCSRRFHVRKTLAVLTETARGESYRLNARIGRARSERQLVGGVLDHASDHARRGPLPRLR